MLVKLFFFWKLQLANINQSFLNFWWLVYQVTWEREIGKLRESLQFSATSHTTAISIGADQSTICCRQWPLPSWSKSLVIFEIHLFVNLSIFSQIFLLKIILQFIVFSLKILQWKLYVPQISHMVWRSEREKVWYNNYFIFFNFFHLSN